MADRNFVRPGLNAAARTPYGILGHLWDLAQAQTQTPAGILGGPPVTPPAAGTPPPSRGFSSIFNADAPLPQGQAGELLQCMETRCPAGTIGRVSSTSEKHEPGDPHSDNQAIDIKTGKRRQAMICGANCGAKFQLDEYARPSAKSNGPHIHLQTRAGRGGATGPYYPPPIPLPRPEDYR